MDEWASALEAKSDQINAIDLIGGPQTFTIESVSHGTPEQPMNIHLVESPGKAYRPSRTMRRFMAKTWGWPPTTWSGKRLTVYRNPKTRFGKDEVGGIEISHVSDISAPMTFVLPGAKGARPKSWTAQPLVEQAPVDWLEVAGTVTTIDKLRALYMDAQAAGATPEVLSKIQAHQARIEGEQTNG